MRPCWWAKRGGGKLGRCWGWEWLPFNCHLTFNCHKVNIKELFRSKKKIKIESVIVIFGKIQWDILHLYPKTNSGFVFNIFCRSINNLVDH